MRGDSRQLAKLSTHCHGSSPRAWRQRDLILLPSSATRFISTCVETAEWLSKEKPVDTVHLHVRGDSKCPSKKICCTSGSSPRAWRQHSVKRRFLLISRFISTCVETARREKEKRDDKTVHLHVRGDSPFGVYHDCLMYGSSPRAWRQPHPASSNSIIHWFISTCVETARSKRLPETHRAVHLHVRGDSVTVRWPSS